MTRPRRTIAVACIALVVVAGFLPLGGVSLDWFVIPTAFVLLDWLTPTGPLVESVHCDAPATSYLRSIDSRGPPSLSLV